MYLMILITIFICTEFLPPTLPANFAHRPQLLKHISTAILKTNLTYTSEVTVTIRGIGGIGKSTIAKAICHEQSIKEHFTDGFLWISLTPPHHVSGELCKIYNKLTNQPIERNQSLVKEKIKSHLNSCSYKLLVILDDVWEAEDALTYVEVFQSCKMLLTTRKSIINSEVSTKNSIDIGSMELDEAVKLLTSHVDAFRSLDDSGRVLIYKLAEYLYCWPLLLNLVRTQLYIYCTEWKMSPSKAMELATQKLSKSFTAFDQSSREKAVKICLDTSLNLLPEQHTRVLHYVILTLEGFGPYAMKQSVARTSKMSIEQLNMCVANLWSHGLIELIDIPTYPTNQCFSCIGVHHILAHYITETIPLEELYNIISSITDFSLYLFDFGTACDDLSDETNLSILLLHIIPLMTLYCIRVTSLLACALERILSEFETNSSIVTNGLSMENMYSKMNRNCAMVSSLFADNKYNDIIEWLSNYHKTHPVLHMQKRLSKNILLDGKSFSLEDAAGMVDCLIQERLIPLISLHKFVAVLMKLKASNEDIIHLFDCFFSYNIATSV